MDDTEGQPDVRGQSLMDEIFHMACGCVLRYDLENVGDYGYGFEIVDKWEIKQAELTKPCSEHGGVT